MPRRIAAIATCAAALAAPVAAYGSPTAIMPEHHHAGRNGQPSYEKRYLEVRKDFVKQVGLHQAGRNIVRDGYRERDRDVHKATKAEVTRSIGRMESALKPAKPMTSTAQSSTTTASASAASTSTAPTATSSGGGVASSTVQCESGGNYSAVNPAGYYGAYQFDQQTWDAYAPAGYKGVNPAQAPPSVQDQAAANVPYDAWPNC